MIDSDTALILIPARAGSARVKNKNLRVIGGKRLVEYQIETGLRSQLGRVIVSTNSKTISNLAMKCGAEVPFFRPTSISGANATSLSVIEHALKWLINNEGWIPEFIAFCPPTNPFLRPGTLREMYSTLKNSIGVNSIVTITEAATHPFRLVSVRENGSFESGHIAVDSKKLIDYERSQDWPEIWEGSPACRMTRSTYFLSETKTSDKTYDIANFIGHKISRLESFDIDDPYDLRIANALMDTR